MDKYMVVIGRTRTGYSAHCPDIAGCAAVGSSVEEVVTNMKDAIEFHFEGMIEDGDPLPAPGGIASYQGVMQERDAEQCLLAHVLIDRTRFAAAVSQS
jgi:predicted RNase H-like HicB family nuclease